MSKFFVLNPKKKKEEIYFKYADAMMILCLRYTGNKEDSEEVMNNGFMKIFKNLNKFNKLHENSFSAWIKKIMINECLMHLRQKKGFNVISIDDIKIDSTSYNYLQNIDTEYLLNTLEKLPIGYRTVFNMYAIEGYKHKEIAEILKISESTSRTQLHKARKQLQKIIIEQNLRYGS